MQLMPARQAEVKAPLRRSRRSARGSSRNRLTGPGRSSSSSPGDRSLQGSSSRGSHSHRTPGSKNSRSSNRSSRTSHGPRISRRGHSKIRRSSSVGHSSIHPRNRVSSSRASSRASSKASSKASSRASSKDPSRDRRSRDSRSSKGPSNLKNGSGTAISVRVHTIMISPSNTGLMMNVSPSNTGLMMNVSPISRYHQPLPRQGSRSSSSNNSTSSSRFLRRHRRSLTSIYIRKSISMKMTRICSGSVKPGMIPPSSERQQHPILR
jgi:hypothetical protein